MRSEPRGNALRETLDAGEPAFGVLDNVYSPTVVELLGELGFDFVWVDYEHAGPSPWDADEVADMLRAADASGTELLVRIPDADPSLVRKALDAGVRNLFVSRVETAEQAERAVEAARFTHDGEPGTRGMAGPRAAKWGTVADYPAVEDRETVVGVTVETMRGVENIEEIVDVPDLGFVFAGPNDLSVSLGHPGEVNHDDVQAAVETIRTACRANDVPVGNLTFGMEDVQAKVAEGYQILNVGSATGAIRGQLGDWHARYRDSE
ncbi:MAG: HpcH/HpaI aldolase/citrate lyase family protein [Halobacteriaceae archaeon]